MPKKFKKGQIVRFTDEYVASMYRTVQYKYAQWRGRVVNDSEIGYVSVENGKGFIILIPAGRLTDATKD